ncbi:MAG: papain-like cysteine protease family protein [Pseudomonadota bacterium]
MRLVTAGAAAEHVRTLFAAGILACWSMAPQAAETCNAPDARGTVSCTAGMSEARIREIAISQERSQWCWAASMSMIFAHHGLRVPQEHIVKDVHGKVEDVNAPSGEAMTSALRRRWRDQMGNQEFAVNTRTGDIAANRYEITNAQIADELTGGRPLLIGTKGHAMVLVKANYERRTNGDVVITGGTVIDPMPDKGVRKLARAEMVLSYVAAVEVSEVRDGAKVHALNTKADDVGREF